MKIIIIGCGRMGSGLAQALNLRGHTVTVIDKDPDAFGQLGPAFHGKTVVGIGFDRDVLLRAGIERADGLAAVTASDEANVVSARLASQVFRVPRVVARLYDPAKAEIYSRLGLITISPLTWGIDRTADLLSYFPLNTVFSVGSGAVDMQEFDVPAQLVGRAVEDLWVPAEMIVVAITRSGRTFMPTLGTVFQEGDLIHMAVIDSSEEHLKQMLGFS